MNSASADLSLLVRKLELHSPLSAEERTAVRSLPFQLRTLAPHAPLSRDGEAARHCHLLLEGYALRYKQLADGARQALNVLLRGDLIGLARALFGRADHGVEMATGGQVATVLAADVEALAAAHPRVARALWADTLLDGAIQREWTVNVGRRNARARVAHLLCEVAARQRQAGLDGRELPFTQQQVADCAGLTAVHVNRVLQRLRRDGLLGGENRRMLVADWNGLAAVAGFDDRYLRGRAEAA